MLRSCKSSRLSHFLRLAIQAASASFLARQLGAISSTSSDARPAAAVRCQGYEHTRLLLLLLSTDKPRLLVLLKKLGPFFVRRKLLVGRKHGLRGRYSHSYLELCVDFSF